MKTRPVEIADWQGVFPVPPLATRADARRSLDIAANQRIVEHIRSGGIRNFLYGGNAFLYHLTLSQYEELIEWMAAFPDELWAIPSAGPSFGRLMDQAPILRRHRFPCVMHLPCGDPRDAAGIERGLREFSDACETPLIVYVKEENNLGSDRDAGLDAVARLIDSGVCVAIKYAVVRKDPADDPYLRELIRRVDPRMVLSGIGERPAVVHLRDFGLPGFTTGSGCIAPDLSRRIFEACRLGDYATAMSLRDSFLPLEDLRDAWGPARVLHAATAAAGIAEMGHPPPFVSAVNEMQLRELAPVAGALAASSVRASAAPRA